MIKKGKMKEDKRNQPLKGNKEKWVCKKCGKPIELWGKGGFIPSCMGHIKIGDDLEKVGKPLNTQNQNKEN